MDKTKRISNWFVKHKFIFFLLFSFLIIFLSTLSIFIRKGNIVYDDIVFHTNRILGIADALKGGQFPVKYYPYWYDGAGYLGSIFYGDIFLYIPAVLVIMGVPLKASYYFFVFLILLATYISFYFLIKKFTQNKNWCIVGSTIFVLSQYVYVDLFFRGAIGESIGIIFLIWLCIGIFNMLKENFSKPYILSIAMLGLLYSHIISLVFGICFLLLFVLLNAKKLFKQKSFWLKSLLAFSIFLVLGAYFILSFIEMYTSNTYKISTPWAIPSDYAYDLFEMFFASIYGIGFVALFPFVFRLLLRKNEENKEEIKTINLLLIISAVFIVFASAAFPWEYVQKYVMFIQFPWRIQHLTTIMLTIVLVLELRIFFSHRKAFVINFLVILTPIVLVINNFLLVNIHVYNFDHDPLYHEWLPVNYEPMDAIITDDDGNEITYNPTEHKVDLSFSTNSDSSHYTTFVVFYKGYTAEITLDNGTTQKLEVRESEKGTVVVETNGLEGEVRLWYKGTTTQNVSLAISSVGFAGVIIVPITLYIIKKRKQKKQIECEVVSLNEATNEPENVKTENISDSDNLENEQGKPENETKIKESIVNDKQKKIKTNNE